MTKDILLRDACMSEFGSAELQGKQPIHPPSPESKVTSHTDSSHHCLTFSYNTSVFKIH